ncbi:MAG: hypothetical protein FWH25_00675 [Syntrophorhabdaceae bacterium]|nr:hypothetical protein [Syntrophorhabdaceae bacterium]
MGRLLLAPDIHVSRRGPEHPSERAGLELRDIRFVVRRNVRRQSCVLPDVRVYLSTQGIWDKKSPDQFLFPSTFSPQLSNISISIILEVTR